MSLINQMLQDLDKRHASQGGLDARSEGLAQYVRPVTPRNRVVSDVFWRIMAVSMLIAVGWVAWLVWQLTPRPVVTELAYDSARKQATSPGETTLAAPAAATASVAAIVTASSPIAADATRAGGPPPAAARDKVSFDMLRLATEMTTPILERARAVPKPGAPKKTAAPRQSAGPAVASTVPVEAGKIERRANTTPAERAESEFRRAVTLVNQGRIAEGMDGLRNVLKISPTHETARQTLVALLLEAKRVDEAAAALQEGLALNPENTGFAMLLARILVERNDVFGALAVLQKHTVPPDLNPDFHAFAAALYQRLNRHKEAIEQYQAALRLAPSAGIWWVGLGMSYQAVDLPKEALEAFNTAKSAGSLAPDLIVFVDQRLKQLK